MTTHLVLVRHAQSRPVVSIPEPDWPLTDVGNRQARDLIRTLPAADKFYSSPYLRALETLRPSAEHQGLEITIVEALRERKLADGKLEDWEAALSRSWQEFDHRLPGGESSRECQQRVQQALHQIAVADEGQVVIVCSHGNAIALFLNTIDPDFGFQAWKKMQNPHVFNIRYHENEWSYTT